MCLSQIFFPGLARLLRSNLYFTKRKVWYNKCSKTLPVGPGLFACLSMFAVWCPFRWKEMRTMSHLPSFLILLDCRYLRSWDRGVSESDRVRRPRLGDGVGWVCPVLWVACFCLNVCCPLKPRRQTCAPVLDAVSFSSSHRIWHVCPRHTYIFRISHLWTLSSRWPGRSVRGKEEEAGPASGRTAARPSGGATGDGTHWGKINRTVILLH